MKKKDWTAEDLEELDKEFRSLDKRHKEIMLWVDEQMEQTLEEAKKLRKKIENTSEKSEDAPKENK